MRSAHDLSGLGRSSEVDSVSGGWRSPLLSHPPPPAALLHSSAALHPPAAAAAAAAYPPVPFASVGYMYGSAQESFAPSRALPVALASATRRTTAATWSALDHQDPARAVDAQADGGRQAWQPLAGETMNRPMMREAKELGFGGAAWKQPMLSSAPFADTQQHVKELSLPRLESVLVGSPSPLPSVSLSDLPPLPSYLESLCFSCPQAAAVTPVDVFARVRQALQDVGATVAQPRPWQLECCAAVGTSCAEFHVRCYRGDHRSPSAAAASDAAAFCVEFQRRSGCCYASAALFKHVVRSLRATLGAAAVQTSICVLAVAAAPTQAEGAGDAMDLSGLSMPGLVRCGSSLPPQLSVRSDDDQLYASLCDMIQSDAPACQMQGLAALASCIEVDHPRIGEVLNAVATVLRTGCPQVRSLASRLVSQAAARPAVSAAVAQHCLPAVLSGLMSASQSQPSSPAGVQTLDAACALGAQQACLDTLVRLAPAVPASLPRAFDVDAACSPVLANSRLKRELLRMAASPDATVRRLAASAIQVI